jgi:hypothetical protein
MGHLHNIGRRPTRKIPFFLWAYPPRVVQSLSENNSWLARRTNRWTAEEIYIYIYIFKIKNRKEKNKMKKSALAILLAQSISILGRPSPRSPLLFPYTMLFTTRRTEELLHCVSLRFSIFRSHSCPNPSPHRVHQCDQFLHVLPGRPHVTNCVLIQC